MPRSVCARVAGNYDDHDDDRPGAINFRTSENRIIITMTMSMRKRKTMTVTKVTRTSSPTSTSLTPPGTK